MNAMVPGNRVAAFDPSSLTLRIEQRDRPAPGQGQIVMAVKRCGICSSDLQWTRTAGRLPPGVVLGHELSGIVVALGEGVDHLADGDKVSFMPFTGCGRCDWCARGLFLHCPEKRSQWGGFGEYAIADARSCVKLDPTLSFAQGAMIEPFACGLRAARRSGLGAGDRAIIFGAGPIGLASCYWLSNMGVDVWLVARSDRRSAIAMKMGASRFIAGEAGADDAGSRMIFECSGAPGMLEHACRIAPGLSTVIVAGMAAGEASIDPASCLTKEVSLAFCAAYGLQDFADTADHFAGGDIRPLDLIDQEVSLDELPGLFERMLADNPYCKAQLVLP
ncbi:alcohol dehydrogenase catalytic domain-containing protein [Sphingobium sp. JS3065]|uniref:zinc-dependent alcohol dehydrogenase n=1 Tax=Sphingobium sp. JS3065 TaxID=2970925 RepID=UPI002263DB81|nr:alcohol dehydrogenase catalytic domain-containing protein [Sphingobium sp. JS3065]UZW57508.1 alcohol dehydrogenase catalytic domain-containing protein [Sphingobium sp. JS3065]